MIDIALRSYDTFTAEVVVRAFERSFTRGQVRLSDHIPRDASLLVVLGAREEDAEALNAVCNRGACKLLLLGPLGAAVSAIAGIVPAPIPDPIRAAGTCPAAVPHSETRSAATVQYRDGPLASPIRTRAFCRYDFNNEWNNLGFGRIALDEDRWSITQIAACRRARPIADFHVDDAYHGTVVSLREFPHASILWFARPVGPVDGPDWRLVEAFFSDHRYSDLPCRPFLRDVPHGVAAAVTMRLDCDEAVTSAQPLLELYRARGLPISLAVTTGRLEDAEFGTLATVRAVGGAILSHSVTHRSNWGGSAEGADFEARTSKAHLEAAVPGLVVRYAVSPFHQNPPFVSTALARAGYRGVIAGSIANDPEVLLARGGTAPLFPDGFVTHSQSCMLHGDCLLDEPDPLRVYGEAFAAAMAGGQFFGYLDHPFSERYCYGWSSEIERRSVHARLLDGMEAACLEAGGPLLFVNEDTCLDFMAGKTAAQISFDAQAGRFTMSSTHAAGLPFSVGFGGAILPAHE